MLPKLTCHCRDSEPQCRRAQAVVASLIFLPMCKAFRVPVPISPRGWFVVVEHQVHQKYGDTDGKTECYLDVSYVYVMNAGE